MSETIWGYINQPLLCDDNHSSNTTNLHFAGVLLRHNTGSLRDVQCLLPSGIRQASDIKLVSNQSCRPYCCGKSEQGATKKIGWQFIVCKITTSAGKNIGLCNSTVSNKCLISSSSTEPDNLLVSSLNHLLPDHYLITFEFNTLNIITHNKINYYSWCPIML